MELSLRILLSISKFGQKSTDGLMLPGMVSRESIKCASVHVVVTLMPVDGRVHVMWSRTGLQSQVGNRGTLFPALSMAEAANFQSALDGRPPYEGASDDWTRVPCIGEMEGGKLTFVQAYTDSPHTHLSAPWKHPVSGVIATMGVLHHELNKTMHGRALSYLELMEDLAAKFV